MAGKVVISGTEVEYSIAYGISANRANPNRLTALCGDCLCQFMSLQCSDRVIKKKTEWIEQQLRRHKQSGYCISKQELTK